MDLTIINKEGKLVTDSREVAVMVDKEHGKLLRDIRTYNSYLAEANFGLGDFFIDNTYLDDNSQERPCYLLTRKGCDLVANKMSGAKGVLFTAMYVSKFEEMEKQLYTQIPQNYRDALLEVVKQIDITDKLQIELEENKPKVEGFRKFMGTDNLLSWDTVAKNLGLGRNTMLKTLRAMKILQTDEYEYNGKICHSESHNVPYQAYMKYFDVKYTILNGKRYPTTLVSAKGQEYLRKKLAKTQTA